MPSRQYGPPEHQPRRVGDLRAIAARVKPPCSLRGRSLRVDSQRIVGLVRCRVAQAGPATEVALADSPGGRRHRVDLLRPEVIAGHRDSDPASCSAVGGGVAGRRPRRSRELSAGLVAAVCGIVRSAVAAPGRSVRWCPAGTGWLRLFVAEWWLGGCLSVCGEYVSPGQCVSHRCGAGSL
jgi:hypothetical protein